MTADPRTRLVVYARRLPSTTPDPVGHSWREGERTELGEPITRCRGCGAAKHWDIAKLWCSKALPGVAT